MYKSILHVIWDEKLSGGDLTSVVFWSIFVFIPIGLIYFLVCLIIKYKVNASLRYLLYPLYCALAGVIPISLILVIFGGGLDSFFSLEGQLFNVFFIASGITFGLGYGLVQKLFDKPSSKLSNNS